LSDQILKDAEQHMAKAIEHTREDFASVRTGRASPALVSKITVEYYGTPTPLQQLAGVHVADPRSLVITPYDRSAIQAVEKAIMASDIGITPSNDGQNIRLDGLTQRFVQEIDEMLKRKEAELLEV